MNGHKVSIKFLQDRANQCIAKGYQKQKWVEFCESAINQGFSVYLYEARRTVSKYVTLVKNEKQFKVRFSNHKPIKHRELQNDCDFFVGVTHTGIRNTKDAMSAVNNFFSK